MLTFACQLLLVHLSFEEALGSGKTGLRSDLWLGVSGQEERSVCFGGAEGFFRGRQSRLEIRAASHRVARWGFGAGFGLVALWALPSRASAPPLSGGTDQVAAER